MVENVGAEEPGTDGVSKGGSVEEESDRSGGGGVAARVVKDICADWEGDLVPSSIDCSSIFFWRI